MIMMNLIFRMSPTNPVLSEIDMQNVTSFAERVARAVIDEINAVEAYQYDRAETRRQLYLNATDQELAELATWMAEQWGGNVAFRLSNLQESRQRAKDHDKWHKGEKGKED